MNKHKLGIIGGSGLYDIDGAIDPKWETISTPWGEPSDQVLDFEYDKKSICFLPRHGRKHTIQPSNINFRANIDALKQKGVTDIISVSAVGSLKEELSPGTFVLIDQFIDRTFARTKTFFDDEIVAHVSMAQPTCPDLIDLCEKSLKETNFPKKVVIILGSENKGLRRITNSLCDEIIKIGINDELESLNVSNTAAIAFHDISNSILKY